MEVISPNLLCQVILYSGGIAIPVLIALIGKEREKMKKLRKRRDQLFEMSKALSDGFNQSLEETIYMAIEAKPSVEEKNEPLMPKHLLADLEKGDRTMEVLKEFIVPVSAPASNDGFTWNIANANLWRTGSAAGTGQSVWGGLQTFTSGPFNQQQFQNMK